MQAVGNGTLLPTGVNQQLIPVFSELAGKRLGIVMFDCKSVFTTVQANDRMISFEELTCCSLRDTVESNIDIPQRAATAAAPLVGCYDGLILWHSSLLL